MLKKSQSKGIRKGISCIVAILVSCFLPNFYIHSIHRTLLDVNKHNETGLDGRACIPPICILDKLGMRF